MGRNWAITIGINHYRYLQRLHYAQRDAEVMGQLFSQELGFEQVYHFSEEAPPIPQDYGPDLDSTPTGTTLRRFLRTRFEQPFLREGDNLWFFFAGHGIRHQNRDYLMPLDGDRDDLERSAIPIHTISERLRRSGADNIILLIDACRGYEGRRSGIGIGQEKQQGVITLFSCSPEESSYEIEEFQQGAFTHVLLESLRLQGEGNCATVERLYQRLRHYVPQLTRQYKHDQQTPYGVIEPPSKNHLILLPRQANLTDIATLKKDALTAEVQRNFKGAKQLWVRVLAVSPADPEAIEGIERLRDTTNTLQSIWSSSQDDLAHTQRSSKQKELSLDIQADLNRIHLGTCSF
ncbi:MAG: caspase family protein [Cyanobacteria bacterium J06635_1]